MHMCIYCTCLVECLWGNTNMGRKYRADFHPINHKMLQSLNIHSGMGDNTEQGEEGITAARQSSNSATFPFLHHMMRKT